MLRKSVYHLPFSSSSPQTKSYILVHPLQLIVIHIDDLVETRYQAFMGFLAKLQTNLISNQNRISHFQVIKTKNVGRHNFVVYGLSI